MLDTPTTPTEDNDVPAIDTPPAAPSLTPPPPVIGRYHARVTALLANGEARAELVTTLASPTDDDFAAIYGDTWAQHAPPRACQFIGGLPGELVEVELRWRRLRTGRKRAKHAPSPDVRLLAVVEAATERATPGCPVFGECGGCQLQHMSYPAQLAWKSERVRRALTDVGLAIADAGLPIGAPTNATLVSAQASSSDSASVAPVAPALGCEPPWGYRNHMRFSVNREGQVGLTARHSHRVIPLRACPIAHPRINDALAILGETPQRQPQALVRYGDATGELLLQPAPGDALREQLTTAGFDLHDDAIEEGLHGARFRIRPSSFFQTNTAQANRMADLALAALPSGPDVTLVDAYCGVGTFARLMATQAGRVLAIEESASAIRDARWNLRDAPNVVIMQAKVEDALPGVTERLDGLIIDPPRAGCQRPVLDALIARRIPVVVYVSCDPDTLARDLAYLCLTHGAYRIRSVQPLDMFAQTAHIENVVTLDAVNVAEATRDVAEAGA